MNLWQKLFLSIGIVGLVCLMLFPPQISPGLTIQYLPVWYAYPIDWLRLFFWMMIILLMTGLGVTVNKSDHYR